MTRRLVFVSWAVLLTGVVWLGGTASGLAQAAAEAAGAAAAASAAGGATARATGQAIGSVLGRTAAKVETSTKTATPVASTGAKRTKAQGAASGSTMASIPASGAGAPAGTFTVVGPPPQIHFDGISFKRCAGAGSRDVDLPTDGDYVAYHCQPLFRIIYFAYTGATGSNFNLSGYPSWVETDLYDFEAKVAEEDIATWQEMGLNARRVAVRELLAEELKLKVHVDTTPKPGKAEVDGIVVDHIERPAAY